MDYKKIYDNLINTRKGLQEERKSKKRKKESYYEAHHIIPISKGGEGKTSQWRWHPNIVLLTAREHFLAHWILWRIYKDRASALGFHKMMSKTKNQQRVTSSRGYEEARLAFAETQKGNQYGKGHTKTISAEQRKQHSERMKGRYVGDKNPAKQPGVGEKISNSLRGRKKSDEHIKNLIIAIKNRDKKVCEYCSYECDERNYNRWHGENCKKHPNGPKNRVVTSIGEKNGMWGKSGARAIKIQDVKTLQIFDSKAKACIYYKINARQLNKLIKENKIKEIK